MTLTFFNVCVNVFNFLFAILDFKDSTNDENMRISITQISLLVSHSSKQGIIFYALIESKTFGMSNVRMRMMYYYDVIAFSV